MVDTREVNVSLSSELVVRDYLDVFPKELTGLPPHREIEFAIELKVQLHELLVKGFIDRVCHLRVHQSYLLKRRMDRCAYVFTTGS